MSALIEFTPYKKQKLPFVTKDSNISWERVVTIRPL